MTKVYIIITPYQLLISITKTILAHRIGKDEIIVCDKQEIQSAFLNNARVIFKNVIIIPKRPSVFYLHVLLWRNRISRHIPFLFNMLKKNLDLDESFFKNKEIFIFNDLSAIGCLLNLSKIKYNLIEDGLNLFQYKLHFEDSRCRFHNIWESILGVSWKSFGHSECTNSIEVNENKNLLIKHPNIIVSNRSQLFSALKEDEINIITKIFNYKPLPYQIDANSTLLLTQPLSEDCIMTHEKKIHLFRHLVNKYKVGFLYIKKHPREKEDYKKIFPNAIILENGNVPFEIFLLKEKCHFKRVITAYSTAIDAIFCADEKIQMGQEWTLNF